MFFNKTITDDTWHLITHTNDICKMAFSYSQTILYKRYMYWRLVTNYQSILHDIWSFTNKHNKK